MSQKQNNAAAENDAVVSGEYSVKKPRHSWLAAIVCVILAVAVWVVIMYTDDTAYVPLVVSAKDGAVWQCELSDDQIEVKGDLLFLKRAKAVEINLPENITEPGVYDLTVENMTFPSGVTAVAGGVWKVTVKSPKS